jgi:hypothetical protein
VCEYGYDTTVTCLGGEEQWISFEPVVEFKFSNMHAANQIVNGRLVCTVKDRDSQPVIVPVNRDLLSDSGVHYNDFMYCYDYMKTLRTMWGITGDNKVLEIDDSLDNSLICGPSDPNDTTDMVSGTCECGQECEHLVCGSNVVCGECECENPCNNIVCHMTGNTMEIVESPMDENKIDDQ